jgi:hypothetical protein
MTNPTRDTAATSEDGNPGGDRSALQHTRKDPLPSLPFQVVEAVRKSTSDDPTQ